jgi:hypothetical protein
MNKQTGKLICEIDFTDAQFEEGTSGGPHRIRNVVLLGAVSKNSRRYTDQCMRGAVHLYEGVQAYIDHPNPDEEMQGRRSVRNLAGKYIRARYLEGEKKLRADAVLLPNDEGVRFFTIAKTMPEIAGCSHVAKGNWTMDDGVQVVEEITEVFSVDLVARPATTAGVFENQTNQETQDMDYSKITIEELRRLRPDITDTLVKEGAASRDEELGQLADKNEELKKANDEFKAKEAVAAKAAKVDKKLADSKLPKEAITDTFRASLMKAEDDKAIDDMITDRKKIVEPAGVKNMGGEGDPPGQGNQEADEKKAHSCLTTKA